MEKPRTVSYGGLTRTDLERAFGSVASKWRPVIDVTHPDFGATGDGITDDSEAFRLAIRVAVEVGAKSIFAPPGIFHLPTLTEADLGSLIILGPDARFTPQTIVSSFDSIGGKIAGPVTLSGHVSIAGPLSAASIAIGDPISEVNVEKPVWEVKDDNDAVVASCTVVCSNITDGSQVCAIKFYTMIAGTLTLVQTLDSAP